MYSLACYFATICYQKQGIWVVGWDGASIGELIFLNMYYMIFILIISFNSHNLFVL